MCSDIQPPRNLVVTSLKDPTQPALSVAGKTVLVTGAARGLGVTIVDSFAKAHAKAIVLTGRAEVPLNDARVRLEKEYPKTKFIAVSVDIGVPESVTAMFEHLKGHVQQLGIFLLFFFT
jgi:NAD(P)-dependent dehydrogenase (short-subunit alcohol dehydrogenase family)